MNTSRQKKHITLAELKNIMQADKPTIKSASIPKLTAKRPASMLSAASKSMLNKEQANGLENSNHAKQTGIQDEAVARRQERYQQAKALLDYLCNSHPLCFNLKFRKPLKVGIDKDILSLHQDKIAHKNILTGALKIYTLNIRYWKAILNQDIRVDLDGKPAGEVTAEQKAHAKDPYQRALKSLTEHQRKIRQTQNKPHNKAKAQ